jgi:hypothetical protein
MAPLESLAWKPADQIDGVWFGERPDDFGVPLRSTAFALRDGGCGIFSAVRGFASRPLPEGRALSALVAPNHFHNLGLAEQAKSKPDVTAYASTTAIGRLQKKVTRPFADVSLLQKRLLPGFAFLVAPGTRQGETWLSVPGPKGRMWVVGDGFHNFGSTPRSVMGLLLKLLGICPGLRVGPPFRWLVRDRPAYRAWLLEKIASERPTTLAPCHGDVLFDERLPQRLEELVRQRL